MRGRRAVREWPVFTFDPSAPPVPAWLLCSPALPAAWPRLDEFEGDDYRRILVPVQRADGSWAWANIYAAVIPV